MEKKDFIDFATEILDKEEAKKAIGQEIKEAKEIFAEKHGWEKKAVNKAMRDYKDWLKDQGEFTQVDREVAEIIDKVCYENTDTVATESE